jgi:hypothetical protein
VTAGADTNINKTKQNNMGKKKAEESAFEIVMRLGKERFDNGNITGAIAMMQIAEAFEPEERSWID